MSTLPLDVKVLRHAQQLQHLLRKLSPADIVPGEAKYTKNVLLHSSGANLNLCLTNARVRSDTQVLLSLLNNEKTNIYFQEFEIQAFLNVLHSYKNEAWDFCLGVQIKAKRLSWHELVGQLCDVRLHENEFYATKSHAILNLVFIHLSFIFRETGLCHRFMPGCLHFDDSGVHIECVSL